MTDDLTAICDRLRKAELATAELRRDLLAVQREADLRSMALDKAMDLAFEEQKRRLEALNHEQARIASRDILYMPREAWEHRIVMLEKHQNERSGASSSLATLISIGALVISAVLLLWRFLQ